MTQVARKDSTDNIPLMFAVLTVNPAMMAVLTTLTLGDQFGRDGKVTTGFGPGRGDSVADLVLQPDGKIVAGGTSVRRRATTF